MKKGLERISQTEFVTYFYENKKEDIEHYKEMVSQGWHRGQFLTGLKEGEICYSRSKDKKHENYIDR